MKSYLVLLLPVFLFYACAEDKEGTNDPLCNCYRFEHKKIRLDYDEELKKGLESLQQVAPELSDLDLENYKLLITHLQNNPDQNLDSIVFPDREGGGLNYDLLMHCVQDQLKRNTNVKDRVEELDEIVYFYSSDYTEEEWMEYLEGVKKSISRISGMDAWMKPFLMRGMINLVEEKKEMDLFNEIWGMEEIEEVMEEVEEEFEELPPPPPPPVAPIEIEIVEEDDEEEVEVIDWQ